MKTLFLKKIFFYFALSLIIVPAMSFIGKRNEKKRQQCSYTVNNQGTCNINVKVDFVDSGGICTTSVMTIAGGNPGTFVCSGCLVLTNVIVTLNWIKTTGGTLAAGCNGFVDINNASESCTYNTPYCNATGAYQLTWLGSHTDVAY